MRYALLMHYREPAEGEISEEAIAAAREAFGAYGRALGAVGIVMLDAEQGPAKRFTVIHGQDEQRIVVPRVPIRVAGHDVGRYPAVGQAAF